MHARWTLVILAVALSGCGDTSTATKAGDTSGAVDAGADTAADASADATLPDAAIADTGPGYLASLQECWADLKCKRAFVISHGGDWSLKDFPYDSKSSFLRAWQGGADGIKTDFHVTKDNVPVVAHSSPILGFESLDCADQIIEEMTAAEVTACHLFPSETETYQRVDDVLEWARGKLTIMLTIKKSKDFARAIQLVREHHAEDYVFLEVKLGDLEAESKLPDADKVWVNAELGGPEQLDALVALKHPRVLMAELDGWPDLATVRKVVDEKIHPAGWRAFASSKDYPSVAQHQSLWEAGFDVVMSYNLVDGVAARKLVNTARGVVPP